MRAAGAAAALALENQRLAAELRARIEDLRASRARLVEAGDAERRRLERDLHDGAQSRLVALALKLQLARMHGGRRLGGGDAARGVERRAPGVAGRAARARARPAPGGAHRPRARARRCASSRAARRCRSRSRRCRPAAAAAGRDRRVLRRRRGADQRRQVRAGDAADGLGRGRRRPRSSSRSPTTGSAAPTSPVGLGPARARPTASRRSTGRLELGEPAGRRHAAARRDPALRRRKAAHGAALR